MLVICDTFSEKGVGIHKKDEKAFASVDFVSYSFLLNTVSLYEMHLMVTRENV